MCQLNYKHVGIYITRTFGKHHDYVITIEMRHKATDVINMSVDVNKSGSSTVLHSKRVDFFVNLHAKFIPSNIEPWLIRPVSMYLLSYRDHCF